MTSQNFHNKNYTIIIMLADAIPELQACHSSTGLGVVLACGAQDTPEKIISGGMHSRRYGR